MNIMLTIFDVSIKEKRVYGSLCFELLPQQVHGPVRASMPIRTSRSCWRPYIERLMVFRE